MYSRPTVARMTLTADDLGESRPVYNNSERTKSTVSWWTKAGVDNDVASSSKPLRIESSQVTSAGDKDSLLTRYDCL